MNHPDRPERHPWLNRCVRGACVCLTLATGTTWVGATYDFPLDAAVVTGMNAPECEPVRALPPGVRLDAPLPDNDVCLPFFLYRASFSNAADDAQSYRSWVLQERVGEFWQLIGYVLVLWFVALGGIAFGAMIVRRLIRHLRHERRPDAKHLRSASHD